MSALEIAALKVRKDYYILNDCFAQMRTFDKIYIP